MRLSNSALHQYSAVLLPIALFGVARGAEGDSKQDLGRAKQLLSDKCTCVTQWQCQCCTKPNNDFLHVRQNLCADWLINGQTWEVESSIKLNNATIFRNRFSANQIPPFCVVLWPPLPLTGCIQLHSLSKRDNKQLHGCANFTLNFVTFNIVNWQIGCFDIGKGGIHISKPYHDAAEPVPLAQPPPTPPPLPTPQVTSETSDSSKTNSTAAVGTGNASDPNRTSDVHAESCQEHTTNAETQSQPIPLPPVPPENSLK